MSYGPSPFAPAPPEPAPPTGGRGLHPLGLGNLLGLAWRMFRFGWRPLLGSAAIFMLPLYGLQAVVFGLTAGPFNEWMQAWEAWFERVGQLMEPGAAPVDGVLPPLPAPPAGFFEAIIVGVLVGIVAALIGYLGLAAAVHAAGEMYEGRHATAVGSARSAVGRAGALIGALLVQYVAFIALGLLGFGLAVALIAQGAGALAFVGVVLLVSAVVLLFVLILRWYFVPQAIVLEGHGALAALGRSWRLVSGSTLRLLGYLIVLSLLIGLVSAVALTALGLLLSGGRTTVDPLLIGVQSLLGGLVSLLLLPYTMAFGTLLYYDIRWRRGELGPAAGAAQPAQPTYPQYPPRG